MENNEQYEIYVAIDSKSTPDFISKRNTIEDAVSLANYLNGLRNIVLVLKGCEIVYSTKKWD